MRLVLYQNDNPLEEESIQFGIISGGQTGVDRAALDAATAAQIPRGGWCPKGRLALDGPISLSYPLTETASPEYPVRTRMNVASSQATLVLHKGKQGRGTKLTTGIAKKQGKPLLVIDIRESNSLPKALAWISEHRVRILNVAGPRETSKDAIYSDALRFLDSLIRSVEQKG